MKSQNEFAAKLFFRVENLQEWKRRSRQGEYGLDPESVYRLRMRTPDPEYL